MFCDVLASTPLPSTHPDRTRQSDEGMGCSARSTLVQHYHGRVCKSRQRQERREDLQLHAGASARDRRSRGKCHFESEGSQNLLVYIQDALCLSCRLLRKMLRVVVFQLNSYSMRLRMVPLSPYTNTWYVSLFVLRQTKRSSVFTYVVRFAVKDLHFFQSQCISSAFRILFSPVPHPLT